MKTNKLLLIAGMLFLFTAFNVTAQNDEGFIYGKVITIDDDVYQGLIRWDDEEIFWFDLFNSTKQGNEFLRHLSRDDKERLEDEHSDWFDNWDLFDSGESDYDHTFVCQFGDISKIRILDSDEVMLTFKDGTTFDLEGGSNDIGTTIYVLDEELGEFGIKWSRIDEVVFMPAPEYLERKYGEPIYGTVYTEKGDAFSGYIQWDHDERLSVDELDGDHDDGDVSIRFEKIKSIEKTGSGSDVVLASGREMYLRGSNDVNRENRGVIVNVPDFGRIDIPWDEFEKVEFDLDHKKSGPGYETYPVPERLTGTVFLEDETTVSGLIIFDLDESYDFEIIQGELDDMEFLIPLRYIKVIDPKNYNFTKIEFRDGKKVILGEMHDVTYDNYGVLVMSDDEYQYYLMREIEKIEFK